MFFMMELIERFIQAEGITLTDEQKELVLDNYQRLIVPDIDNLSNERILQVFVTRRDKKREATRVRAVAECRSECSNLNSGGICGNIRSAEKKKFGEHFRMHIRKDRQKVLDVRFESEIYCSLLPFITRSRSQSL